MPRPKKKQSFYQGTRGSKPVARTYAKDAATIIPRCRCGNLASACSNGKCWTCAALPLTPTVTARH